jgi:hypothetical protein
LLYLPWPDEEEAARVMTIPVLEEVLCAMVLDWEPDAGVVVSSDFRDALRQEGDGREFGRRGDVPPLPEPVRVIPVEDKGTLVVLTPERLRAGNPEHLALGRRVQEVLDEKNLLRSVLS